MEITVTITDKAKPKDFIVVPITAGVGKQFATDYIEYDVAQSKGSPKRGNWYYSPFKGNDSKAVTLLFKKGEGIDQFGRDQTTAPEIQGGPGVWEHRVIGLCSSAPGPLPRQGLVFRGGRPGTFTIYIDNLRVRHMDGSTTPLWTKGKDTRFQKIADTELYKDIKVRTVDAAALPRSDP